MIDLDLWERVKVNQSFGRQRWLREARGDSVGHNISFPRHGCHRSQPTITKCLRILHLNLVSLDLKRTMFTDSMAITGVFYHVFCRGISKSGSDTHLSPYWISWKSSEEHGKIYIGNAAILHYTTIHTRNLSSIPQIVKAGDSSFSMPWNFKLPDCIDGCRLVKEQVTWHFL